MVDDPSSDPERFSTDEAVENERQRLFKIIEDLVIWENSTNEEVIERARVEIRKSCAGELPPIYDPFSGGGSIPLEAQRLGLPAFGSDLNPVAVMIGKAMIEIPPRYKDCRPVHRGVLDRNHYRNAEGLAEDVRFYGRQIREQALERIGNLYPDVTLPKELGGGNATPMAWKTFLSGSTPTRAMITGGVCSAYGLSTWGHLFSDRQMVALLTFSELVHAIGAHIERDAIAAGLADDKIPLRSGGTGAKAYAEAVSVYLAFAVDKCADYWSSLCSWHSSGEKMRNTFGRQALPMVWDYAEANPFCDSSGNWGAMLDWVWKTVENIHPGNSGVEVQSDAQAVIYPPKTVISTDPPYYDNIAYADLSDFFFCWMKPSLKHIYPDLFGLLSTPKAEELVATQFRRPQGPPTQ